MTFRVTNRMMYNNTLISLNRQNEGMLKSQEELASGKRVNRPSDDPLAASDIMRYKLLLGRNEKFQEIDSRAASSLNTSESYVGSAGELSVRARELAIQQSNATATAATRRTAAHEIHTMIEQAIQIGNTQLQGGYIFSGRTSNIAPLDSSGNYVGDYSAITAGISEGHQMDISVLASDFLTADLHPRLSNTTPVSTLNGGGGISAGSFTITDRAGGTGTITVGAGNSIGNVINAINASGANVTASISSDGMAIEITDNTALASINQSLTIAESGGTTAADLGIVGSRPLSAFTGDNLNPALTGSTLLSDLYGGSGITFDDISVVNGSASATISFSTATTVSDVISAINGSGANVTASINSAGTSLSLASNNSATVAYAKDINGNTAEMLGIGGGKNLITTLQRLEAALNADDLTGILGQLENLDTAIGNISELRGIIGARVNRIENTRYNLEIANFNTTVQLSEVQDADMAKAASDLALLQFAYQATAKASASIIQPSLLDFLR
ncbi:MAG: flagellar hook-associated protein FlgL [Nitrospinota bacterium]